MDSRTEVSTWSVHENYSGRRICFDMTEEDALEIFVDCKPNENPVAFLKRCQKERRRLQSSGKKSFLSFVGFIFVLFFFRRFIP